MLRVIGRKNEIELSNLGGVDLARVEDDVFKFMESFDMDAFANNSRGTFFDDYYQEWNLRVVDGNDAVAARRKALQYLRVILFNFVYMLNDMKELGEDSLIEWLRSAFIDPYMNCIGRNLVEYFELLMRLKEHVETLLKENDFVDLILHLEGLLEEFFSLNGHVPLSESERLLVCEAGYGLLHGEGHHDILTKVATTEAALMTSMEVNAEEALNVAILREEVLAATAFVRRKLAS
jgi:hypothetical protein